MKFMGIDQFGNTFHDLEHPRKDLMERLGYKSATRMFNNTKEGVKHVGYVIGQHWIRLFKVEPFQKPA